MRIVTNNLRLFLAGMLLPVASFAQEAHAAATGGASYFGPIGLGLGIGLAVFAAASAQGRIASSFMTGVSRNPGAVNQMRTPLILSLIFVETLVLFTVLICFMLLGKI